MGRSSFWFTFGRKGKYQKLCPNKNKKYLKHCHKQNRQFKHRTTFKDFYKF